jgi:hypothetical protein
MAENILNIREQILYNLSASITAKSKSTHSWLNAKAIIATHTLPPGFFCQKKRILPVTTKCK